MLEAALAADPDAEVPAEADPVALPFAVVVSVSAEPICQPWNCRWEMGTCCSACGAGDDGGRGTGDDADDCRFVWSAWNDGEVSGLSEDTLRRNITEHIELDLIAGTTCQHSHFKGGRPIGKDIGEGEGAGGGIDCKLICVEGVGGVIPSSLRGNI